MSLSRRLARPLLSGIFVFGGLDAARHPGTKVKAAERVARPIAQRVPGIPEDTETLVRINGIVQVGAGLALSTGKFRRVAALVLIGSVIPTTVAGHRFWEEADEATRADQQFHFLKNLGLLGGLLLAAVDTEGAPSLGWRARRRAERVGHAVSAGGPLSGHLHAGAGRAGDLLPRRPIRRRALRPWPGRGGRALRGPGHRRPS
jgi:putative oxidoreductase